MGGWGFCRHRRSLFIALVTHCEGSREQPGRLASLKTCSTCSTYFEVIHYHTAHTAGVPDDKLSEGQQLLDAMYAKLKQVSRGKQCRTSHQPAAWSLCQRPILTYTRQPAVCAVD